VSADWAYLRVNAPAPVHPWERHALWLFLAERAARPGVDVAVSVEYRDTPDGPVDVEVFAVAGHIAARRRLVPADNQDPWAEDEISLHRLDGRVAGATTWRDARLGDVGQALDRAFSDPAVAWLLGDRWGAVVKPRPGKRGQSPLWYAKVALDYVRAVEDDPRKPILRLADGDREKVNTMAKRVQAARRAGMLMGRELTTEALELLRQHGLIEEDG
jgi:hypothetical protein